MKHVAFGLLAFLFSSLVIAQTAVTVNLTDDLGAPLSGVSVYAFNGTSYSGVSAVSNSSGDATLTLVDGAYRFRADFNGTQYFSSVSNNCSTPNCTAVGVQIPRAVEITATSSAGGPEAGLTVYAFSGTTYAGKSAVTNANGTASLQLLSGNYRFRIDKSGTQFFTSQTNDCSVPSCTSSAFEVPESVVVTVTSGGIPNPGLTVYAFDGSTYAGKSAVTNASGEATFTLVSGNYRFRIDKAGTQYFTETSNHCTVAGCNAVSFDIPTQVSVNVSSSAGGPEAGLTVHAFTGSTYQGKSALTDASGVAIFTLLAGDYRFRIDKNGTEFFTSVTNDCAVPGCTSAAYEIPENITVSVTSSSGAFESGLTVYAFNGSTYTNKSATTNANGQAEFTLLPGDYRFRIDKNGTQFFTSQANGCTAPGCIAAAYEIPQDVTVTVTSSGGGVESGLTVYAFNGAVYAGKSAVTNANGQASFTLLPGDYRFRVDKNSTQYFTSIANDCSLPGCTAVSYQVPESVTVNVSNTTGDAESGLIVYAFDEATYSGKSGVTDGAGNALFTLLPGNYRFRTDKGGSQYFSSPVNHCAVPGCTLISQILPGLLSSFVTDPALGACIDSAAAANGWSTPEDVTALSCPNAGISNLSGLGVFSNLTDLSLAGNPITRLDALAGLQNLTNLDLTGTTLLECSQLGSLSSALGAGVIVQPASCLGEGELVFGVDNPNQLDTNQFSFSVAVTPVGDLVSSAITYNPITDSYDGRVFVIDGTNGNEIFEISNPSATGSDYFGWAVATAANGDIVVSAWQDDAAGVAAGAVHIFSGEDGSLINTIENPNPTVGDRFGYAIATNDSGAITIGAYQETGGGAVYLFDATGLLQQTINNPTGDTNAAFGRALASTGSRVVIGAPKQDVIDVGTIADAGVVYVYSEVGAQAELAINNPQAAINDEFGSAVAVAANGDIIASARMIDNNAVDDGSVFVHDSLTGSLIWSVANPIADVSGLFGTSLAGSPQGNVIVGAANDDSGATNTGKVFVFNGSDGGLIDFINAPDAANNANFGQGLAVTDAGQIAVGAFGASGGFGKLYLFTSVGAGPSQPLLNEQPFIDPALQSCVLDQAAPNGWALASEVTTLDCADLGITDLTGLEALTELTSLDLANNSLVDISALESLENLTDVDLSGNNAIACGDLDSLETQLGQGVVTRPATCAGGSGISNQRVQNLHNAMGQRAVKSVDGGTAGTIHFIYDQAGQVIAEIDAATGTTLREYIYVNGVQVALVDDTGTQDEAVYFVHTDHLATPQKITDSAQTVVWSGSYEPFGEVEETVNIVENNIRFPGQYEDGETGLHYNYFRDYDPSLGRYVESDPRGISYDFSDPKRQLSLQSGVGIGGISKNPGLDNTFNYAGQNPLIMVDATGEIYGLIARVINTAFRKCVGSRLACGAAGGAFGGYKVDQRLEVQRRCQLECEQATQQCTEKGDTRELNRCKTKCVETSWGQKFRRAPWVKKL